MLRQSAKLLLNRAAVAPRAFTTSALRLEEQVSNHATEVFAKKWVEVNPEYLSVPAFGKDYLSETNPDPEPGAALPSKLKFNFFMPHQIEMQNEEVEMVLVPGASGDFGILPGHVPTVAQLKPGVLSVHTDGDNDVKKYFVSSGFAFIHANSTADVCAVEAVPLDQLDSDSVEKSLNDYNAKLASAGEDELAKAEAQIGVEVCSAMKSALSA